MTPNCKAESKTELLPSPSERERGSGVRGFVQLLDSRKTLPSAVARRNFSSDEAISGFVQFLDFFHSSVPLGLYSNHRMMSAARGSRYGEN
jgi:hypothetical protein